MGEIADNWLAHFAENHDVYDDAAEIASSIIKDALAGRQISIHSIVGRAKSVSAAAQKLAEKQYDRPEEQMTDVIGVRVITSYAHGVAQVVERLKNKFTIDEANSVDKRQLLDIGSFGYRSVHLILQTGRAGIANTSAEILESLKIEVQVRSIIEHAWAESDHELRYKSGIDLSSSIARRFAALAAMLEVVDRELDGISSELIELTNSYSDQYSKHEHMDDEFDSARLIGYLAFKRPDAKRLGAQGIVLPFGVASECVKALSAIGMHNAAQLEGALEDQQVLELIRDYADRRDVEPEDLSALVIVAILVGRVNLSLLDRFPSLGDAVVRAVISDGSGQ